MRARYAYDFAPDVVYFYNNSGSTIAKGAAVARNVATVATVPDPAREDGVITTKVLGIKAHVNAAADVGQGNFLGIALADITTADFGPVCRAGPCQALVNTSVVWAVGDPLRAGTTLGAFIKHTTPYAFTAATVLTSATTTATADALLDVFVESNVAGSGGHWGRAAVTP